MKAKGREGNGTSIGGGKVKSVAKRSILVYLCKVTPSLFVCDVTCYLMIIDLM